MWKRKAGKEAKKKEREERGRRKRRFPKPQNWDVGQLGFESSLVPETRLDQIHEKNHHPLKVERDLFIIFLWIHLRTWRIIPLPLASATQWT